MCAYAGSRGIFTLLVLYEWKATGSYVAVPVYRDAWRHECLLSMRNKLYVEWGCHSIFSQEGG